MKDFPFIQDPLYRTNILRFYIKLLNQSPTEKFINSLITEGSKFKSDLPLKLHNIFSLIEKGKISINDLKIEYSELFVIPSPNNIRPYGSAYLESIDSKVIQETGIIGGKLTSHLKKYFKKSGYNYNKVLNDLPDSLVVEIGFLLFLSEHEIKLRSNNEKDSPELKLLKNEIYYFLNNHLLRWLPSVVNKAEQISSSTIKGFYVAYLIIILEILNEWNEFLKKYI